LAEIGITSNRMIRCRRPQYCEMRDDRVERGGGHRKRRHTRVGNAFSDQIAKRLW
jgi:hypothetical protein